MYQPRVIRFQASETPTQIGRILNNDDEGVWVKIKDGYCILNDILTNENEKCDNQIFKIGQWLNK
jgi:ribosomal protein S1